MSWESIAILVGTLLIRICFQIETSRKLRWGRFDITLYKGAIIPHDSNNRAVASCPRVALDATCANREPAW